MIYQYQAYRSDKQIALGTIEADSEKLAEEALYEAGFQYVLNLRARPARQGIRQLVPSLFGVKKQDIVDFSRQLASFLESGSSLIASLQLMEEQIGEAALKDIISDLIKELYSGKSFSQALGKHPDIFPTSFRHVVKTSEKTGDLAHGLKQVSEHLEKQLAIASSIRRALAYPLFIMLMALGVTILMITVIFPPLIQMFSSFDAELPGITLLVIGVVNFIDAFKIQILLLLILAAVLFWLYTRLPAGRRALDRFVLGLPLIGSVILQHNLGLFCRTGSMLLKSGLQLPDIMDIASQSTGTNSVFIEALKESKEKLMQGEGLSKPMAANPLFPRMMVKMIATAEQTGTLEQALTTLASHYERQSEQKIKSLIAWIEPVMTIIIGLVVAGMLFSIIIPIYSIMGKVH